jgi:NDP-sugar pyrophosphorylase family protein
VEKPTTYVSDTINAGVFVLSADIFDLLDQEERIKFEDINSNFTYSFNTKLSLERDILAKHC